MKRLLALTALSLLALSGCTSAPEAEPTETKAESSAPKPSPTPTVEAVTPTPTPTPTPEDAKYQVGDMATLSFGSTVTVLAYEADSALDAPLPQGSPSHWSSVEVEVCNNTAEDGYASSSPWTLRDSDSRSHEPSSVGYNQFPSPQYAWGDAPLFAGDCLRGWITFPVLDGVTVEMVRYVAPSTGERFEWVLG